jgi:hypothetical protein
VLYVSAQKENAIVRHDNLKEGKNFFQKPFTVDDLVRKVKEFLDKDSKPVV